MVSNYDVAQIFVDSVSSVNVLFQETINQMDLGEYKMEPIVTALFGFTGHVIRPIGLINLPLTLGKDRMSKTRIVSFIIVDAPSTYNAILGRPAMITFMVVASALHQKIKFPVGNEVGEVQGDQKTSRKCYVEEVLIEQKVVKVGHDDRPGPQGQEQVNMLEESVPVTAEEEYEEILISPPTGFVKVAQTLEASLKEKLVKFLMKNKDVFAWDVSDLLGVLREGYHQIPLAKEDQDKVSFVTSTETYFYVVMPFGLKNAGATYQRLMDKVFKQQIGKNIEVYVDDILGEDWEIPRVHGHKERNLSQSGESPGHYFHGISQEYSGITKIVWKD
ncbi:uncharacterized protein [Henckelia pumila]|uniref:uncharacterized protein n=1 Tax=Henckelia pumila TaxID=405737 RepID=UPI003C6DD526